ncbi:MAG TPA: tetratricopeptide repeat protein [Hellea balneolensis]|uniref:Tetratricopeptide repeat protein n=1 Tax=Hellea balneolensis TaxID=287478 RepID=A0A7C5R0E5_9PROT|nr:tetratricopeptide repeat protein [Hellea balneolensis]
MTQTTGSPNACTSCHSDKKPDWASATINKWNGATPSLPIHYGQVFHDIQNNQKGAKARLTTLINSSETPVIMRASGYTLLEHGPQNIQTLASGLNSQEPLIRLGAVRGAYGNPLARALLYPLLNDRYRAVRVEVVRSLALSDPTILPRRYQEAYEKAEQEFIQAENQAAWRGEGRMNIGLYFQQSGKEQQAIKAYYASTKLDPYFAPSYVNLANIFYGQGLDAKGGEWLKKGLVNTPDDPDLNFAQGLYLIRQAQGQDALSHLAKAVLHAPDNARYSYVYGVALYDLGQAAKAKSILTQALSYAPDHDDILYYLMTINIAQKNYSDALIYAEKLLARYPNNATIQEQVAKIKIELDKSK